MKVTDILRTDVLIVGGTAKAIELALREHQAGREVMIVTGFTYFGEDLCATLNCGGQTPMAIKRELDRKVIQNRIPFRFRSWPLKLNDDCLFFGNSEGIFAVQAGAIVDFTRNATVAHMSAMPFAAFKAGSRNFTRNVINPRRESVTLQGAVTLKSESVTDLQRAEIDARQQTWSDQNLFTADFCDMDLLPPPAGPDPAGLVYVPSQLQGPLPLKPCAPATQLELGELPTLKDVDVLIIGAGTAGAPAGIAAGRNGVRTLLVEELAHPGGLGTEGRIATYYYGLYCGFTHEVDHALQQLETGPHVKEHSYQWSVECKQFYWERELVRAHADIWYQYTCCGCLCTDGTVTAAMVAGPYGSGLVTCRQIIDSTGNANVASFCGAPTAFADPDEPAVQGAGMSSAIPGQDYMNTDYMFTVDASNQDTARAFIVGRDRNRDNYDLVKLPGTRERRRIVGEIVLQPTDFFKARTYPDTLYVARSNFDTHGFTVHPLVLFQPTDEAARIVQVPMRAMLSPGLKNLLTTGLGISAHRDAMPLIRMQPDVQNQGYAVGLVSAMAVTQHRQLRELDAGEIRRRLTDLDILPQDLMRDSTRDSVPQDLNARIFDQPDFQELHRDFEDGPDWQKATRLALLGDGLGREVLQETLRNASWDQGWDYRGMGQFGLSSSRIDVAIMALARISDDPAPFAALLRSLTPTHPFSHIRACCYFLMKHPAPSCEEVLNQLLEQFTCHAVPDFAGLLDSGLSGDVEVTERNYQLKELYLAGALHACAPDNPIALDFLRKYRDGVHAFYASYATKFLNGRK